MLLGEGGARSDSANALNVRACAVARVVDGSSALVLHCRVPGAAGERLSSFLTKLVGSKKFQQRAQTERSMTVDDSSQDPFSVHCLVAPGTSGAGFILVLAITARNYPRRMVFPPPSSSSDSEAGPQGMLGQLAADVVREYGPSALSNEVGVTGLRQASLGPAALRLMERLCAEFESVGDKDLALRTVQSQVDEVHGVMQDNVNSMLRNADKLEDLRAKSTAMGDNSKQFYSLARESRVTQQCREYKLRLLFGGVTLLLFLVFVLPWLTGGGDDDKDQQ